MKLQDRAQRCKAGKKSVCSKHTHFSRPFPHHGNIIDLLYTAPSSRTFKEKIKDLKLSYRLEEKVLSAADCSLIVHHNFGFRLNKDDEKELATEVLMRRHRFTELVFENDTFRQAALSVIQNIYLFKERRIFFGTTDCFGENERQKALYLFSQSPDKTTIPLAQTFQHLMVARIWNRITTKLEPKSYQDDDFNKLHDVVEELNTLRNIYMILSMGLVARLTAKINEVYRQSISDEDARQIGSFGIARAAYRYHPANGSRFSTYAYYWILREIQRQALEGRLIRISAHLVENFAREAKKSNTADIGKYEERLRLATTRLFSDDHAGKDLHQQSTLNDPEESCENKQRKTQLLKAIDEQLSGKSRDILLRRYGLGKHQGRAQSVLEIARAYGVTRGSIYQLEKTALKKLHRALISLEC